MTDTAEVRSDPFIDSLVRLVAQNDRAALAALRRGLGRPPGQAVEVLPYVMPFVSASSNGRNRAREDAMFVVAALFGAYPHHSRGAERWHGASPLRVLRALLRDAGNERDDATSTERRILALLNADRIELPTHLRHLVSLIDSYNTDRPLDYVQLLWDITRWDSPDRHVQRRWARDWWAGQISLDGEPGSGEGAGTDE